MHESVADLETYLRSQEDETLLRFMTCGSVDDGKSTLIGRLLYETKLIFDDELATLKADSARIGTQGGDLDFALLVDGLAAEREQGITIDVAYRYFTTGARKFIVADAPGHEQYTRNMATAASTADLAVILADVARTKELLPQTRRHTHIATMLGVRRLVLAVNKMDMVGYDRQAFASLEAKYRSFASELGIEHVQCIPLSALRGDNVVTKSARMPWYDGPALLPFLETVDMGVEASRRPFRMPVQWVNRPNPDFRGFAGTVSSGLMTVGDRIMAQPSAREARVARIVTKAGDLQRAVKGEAVTVVLDRDIDIARGTVLSDAGAPVAVADQFAVQLLWMSPHEMMPGRLYVMKSGTNTVQAAVTSLKHKVDVNTLHHLAGKTLGLNEIGVCNIGLDKAIPFEPYADSRALGSFILIDPIGNETVGMGLINFALHRATNIHWQNLQISRDARAFQKGQRPGVIWFTGLSAAGKSTIATGLDKRLFGMGMHTYVLDGDNVRHGLNRDLGFTEADRVENIRRVAEVAALMADAGLLVLVSFISPFRNERQMARNLMKKWPFVEVFVDAPLAICEARDPKGLYRKARRNEIGNFTGINSPYEPPENPEITLDTSVLSADEAVERLLGYLRKRGLAPAN
jgi:bifunctional enzyme CysN/CysC